MEAEAKWAAPSIEDVFTSIAKRERAMPVELGHQSRPAAGFRGTVGRCPRLQLQEHLQCS